MWPFAPKSEALLRLRLSKGLSIGFIAFWVLGVWRNCVQVRSVCRVVECEPVLMAFPDPWDDKKEIHPRVP